MDDLFEVFQREAKKLSNAKWLAQGTIYPDVIESGGAKTKKATTIKSHHNVGGLPETLGLKLLEPLRDLFKDEVRELGVALGLPHDMVYRHPFPGPGLGVRILGEVRRDYADLLRRADHIFIEELRKTVDEATGKTWYDLTSQAGNLELGLDATIARHIKRVLDRTGGKIHGPGGAAELLRINPNSLRSKMRKLGIPFRKHRRDS